MSKLPAIASLWIDGKLSWIERLCLQSFVHHGHEVMLFTYGTVQGLPEGVRTGDAREIWEPPAALLSSCPAAFVADIFRLFLVRDSGMIWVDTDALCLAPFRPDAEGYLIGRVPEAPVVNNGVMALPSGSPALAAMIEAFHDETAIPPWMPERARRRLARVDPGQRGVQRAEIFRTVLGPHALTHMMKRSGEIRHALRPQVLFPVPWHSVDLLFNPHGGHAGWMDDGTVSMHLFTSAVRQWHRHRRPPEGSFLRQAMDDLGFSWSRHG